MKRASYRDAVALIALNDEPGELCADTVAGLASVVIVAALFAIPVDRLARDIVRYRQKEMHS